MELNRFDNQVDRQTTLVPIEVLVEDLAELLSRGQLAPVNYQIALQDVYHVFAHLLCYL